MKSFSPLTKLLQLEDPACCNVYWPALTSIAVKKLMSFAKDSRFCPQSSKLMTLADANTVTKCRFTNNSFKFFIPTLNCNLTLPLIIISLWTRHLRGIKISANGLRSYSKVVCLGEIQSVSEHFTKFNIRKTDFSQNFIWGKQTLHEIQ